MGQPRTKCGELSKKLKNGPKTIHCTLPSYQSFKKLNFLILIYFLPLSHLCVGKLYAIGGTDGTILNTAECYDIDSKTWSTVSPMSFGRKFPGAESLASRVYIVGGNDSNNTRLRSVEMFTPSMNQWVSVAPLLQPRSGLGTVVMNGHMYAIGGHDGKGPLNSVEKYDPLTNRWFHQTPMSVSRDCVGTAKVMISSSTNGMTGLDGGGGSNVNGGSYAGSSSPRTSPVERDVITNNSS